LQALSALWNIFAILYFAIIKAIDARTRARYFLSREATSERAQYRIYGK